MHGETESLLFHALSKLSAAVWKNIWTFRLQPNSVSCPFLISVDTFFTPLLLQKFEPGF